VRVRCILYIRGRRIRHFMNIVLGVCLGLALGLAGSSGLRKRESGT
jgi:hypothetical protein